MRSFADAIIAHHEHTYTRRPVSMHLFVMSFRIFHMRVCLCECRHVCILHVVYIFNECARAQNTQRMDYVHASCNTFVCTIVDMLNAATIVSVSIRACSDRRVASVCLDSEPINRWMKHIILTH